MKSILNIGQEQFIEYRECQQPTHSEVEATNEIQKALMERVCINDSNPTAEQEWIEKYSRRFREYVDAHPGLLEQWYQSPEKVFRAIEKQLSEH